MPPRVTPLPKVAPVIPVERPYPFDDPDWVFEPKFDGFRGLLYIDGDECRFVSKKGLPLKRFARLAQEVRVRLAVRSAILDGEVVAMDDAGHPQFRSLMSGEGHLHYAAFDLLWLNGGDLRPRAFQHRRRLLESLIRETTPLLSHTMAVPATGKDLFEAVKRLDLEGIVCKKASDPYGPRTVWFKVRNPTYTQWTEDRFERFSRRRKNDVPGV
jgi:bifunctional non-homologous end joining protein LigD